MAVIAASVLAIAVAVIAWPDKTDQLRSAASGSHSAVPPPTTLRSGGRTHSSSARPVVRPSTIPPTPSPTASPPASTPPTSSLPITSSSTTSPQLSQFVTDLRQVATDLSVVATDAATAASTGALTAIANDCQSLSADVDMLQGDPVPSVFTANMQSELTSAESDLIAAGNDCNQSVNNNDLGGIVTAARQFNSANALLQRISSQLGG